MDERAYASVWNRASSELPPSYLAQNSYAANGSFPQFAPASQAPPRLPDSGTPFESSFFQCTNWGSSQEQAAQDHKSIFQRANVSRDFSEQMFMQSSQSPLRTSQALSSYECSQNDVLPEKQEETDILNENNTSYGDALTCSQPLPSSQPQTCSQSTAKRVPVFKTARGKASSLASIPGKGKKRLVSPFQEEPSKEHSALPVFTHSQKSAFNPVSKSGVRESTPIKKTENDDSVNQIKTQPLKPRFGKAHHIPNKKVKKENDTDVTHHKSGEEKNEVSHAALSNKAGKRHEPHHGSQIDIDSHSASQPVKDESTNDETNVDVVGTSDIENYSDLEDLLDLTPIQCPIADKKMEVKKNQKNLSTTAKNKTDKLPKSKSNRKVLSELNQDNTINQSHDAKVGRKKMIPTAKGKKKNLSEALKDSKSSQCQPPKARKKKNNLLETSSTKKKTSSGGCNVKSSSLKEMHLKTKKKLTKSSSSSSSKHETMKHGLRIQKGRKTYEPDTDDSNQEIRVSEDSSESILQSSASHDSSKRSSDLTFSRLSLEPSSPIAAQENALDREITHDSNKYIKETTRNPNEEIRNNSRNRKKTTRNEAEETTNPSETVKERVMKLLNSMDDDLWIQCDRCLKWRKLAQIIDAAALPDKWYCTMLPTPGMNCERPEEEWEETGRKYVYYEHQFVFGSVVWAQVLGCPWWPGMVDIDPDYMRYDWFNSTWTYPGTNNDVFP